MREVSLPITDVEVIGFVIAFKKIKKKIKKKIANLDNFFLDIDDCINHTCSNSGTCEDGVNSYFCNCTLGFTGNHCETGIFIELKELVDESLMNQ